MSSKTIATIYFYLISAGAIVLIVVGIFNAVNFGINSTQFDRYPLQYPQGSCEAYPYKYGAYPAREELTSATLSAQEIVEQKQACLTQEELERKQHQINDLKNAITFSLVGAVLFAIHFPLARKSS